MSAILTQPATWYTAFILVLGATILIYARDLTRQSAWLRREGVMTQARVTSAKASMRRIYFQDGVTFNVPVWVATLTYADQQGRERTAQLEASKEKFETIAEGQSIPLRFVPRAPHILEVERGRHDEEARPAYWLGMVILGIGVWGGLTLIEWTAV